MIASNLGEYMTIFTPIEEHKAIFESSLDRDFNKATKLLKNHIENCLEHVLQNSINHPMVT